MNGGKTVIKQRDCRLPSVGDKRPSVWDGPRFKRNQMTVAKTRSNQSKIWNDIWQEDRNRPNKS